MNEARRFLDRPANVRRIRGIFYAACALLVALELVVHRHAGHPWEGVFAFYAGYGFAACVVLVLAAKKLRRVLMRREGYYEADPRHGAPGADPEAPGRGPDSGDAAGAAPGRDRAPACGRR